MRILLKVAAVVAVGLMVQIGVTGRAEAGPCKTTSTTGACTSCTAPDVLVNGTCNTTTSITTALATRPKRINGHDWGSRITKEFAANPANAGMYLAAFTAPSTFYKFNIAEINAFSLTETLSIVGLSNRLGTTGSTFSFINSGLMQFSANSSMNIIGDFTQSETGGIAIELGNNVFDGTGILNATGAMHFNNHLSFDFTDDFDFAANMGKTFLLFDPTEITGLTDGQVIDGVRINLGRNKVNGQIEAYGTIVPEPSTMVLLGAGLAALAGFSYRRKQNNLSN